MMGMALTEKNTTTRTEPESQAETVLADLAETLRWDEAPKALRAVLPLARLLRRVSALRLRQSASPSAGGAASAPLAPPAPRRPLGRRVALRLYALTRPVALPLIVRLHALSGRVLQREAYRPQSPAQPVPTVVRGGGMDAALARSIEAALLTLAMQPRR